ncbi:flavodoxin family protein [Actinoallomurus rhizosphaericola]|uniref:flavodoxin family protein n=1 Tax=Actinoallomurus rhizosphaericola TaxID=2952536 RepID=UPI00209374C2|nr:flavodoxin family protein [Actinoallomurus rhizosphaericola]MCO6000166.1 flavodoxin family protein [Actinoallomurus rhizosphaericola]
MSDLTSPRPAVAVAYHSGYGHTEVLAEAVRRGASAAGADVTFVDVTAVTDEQWQRLDDADAIIFGSPTYMGGASAGFHGFAEATSGRFIEGRWADKLAAGFTNSASKSGDKTNTLAFFAAFAAQHQMLWVSLGLAPGWNATTASEHDLNRLGYWGGAGAQTPMDGGVDTVHSADIATAEHLGARVARQASLISAGRRALSVTA